LKLIHVREPITKKMCKVEWNKLNFNIRKLANYPKRIKHNPLVWELTIKECNKNHLPFQFIKENYENLKHSKENKQSMHSFM